MAKDCEGRIWVYFGTGRFWSTLDRQSDPVNYFGYQNAFYGIKEPVYANNGTLTYGTVGAKESKLINVTGIEITSGDYTSFNTLANDIKNNWDGWYLNFSETGERNLGQAGVLGDIVTFTTFVPNDDLCAHEGRSYLYALYYKTGTAYWKGVLKTEDNNGTGINPDTTK